MSRNMNAWVSEVLTAPQRQSMPIMTYPGLEMVGHNVMDVISDPRKQVACVKALAAAYPSLAALTIMDLSVEAEAFGCPVQYSADEVPTVSAPIVFDESSAQALAVPAIGAGRTTVYLEAAELAAQQIKDRPVLGGMIGPYSLTVRLRDMTQLMMDLMIQPDLVHTLLEKSVQFLIQYAKAFKAVGANGIVIAEPAAGLLSPPHCQEFSSQYVRRIVEAVQDENFAVILHNCGNTVDLVSSLVGTGARGLHFGNAIDMAKILPQVPEHVLAFGNIDPAGIFRAGSPETVKAATQQLLEKMAEYPNFVLSSGCDIPPGTPLANVDAFYEAFTEYNAAQKSTCEKCA